MRGWSLASTSHSYYSSPTYDVSVGDTLCLVIGYGPINRIGLRRDVCSNSELVDGKCEMRMILHRIYRYLIDLIRSLVTGHN